MLRLLDQLLLGLLEAVGVAAACLLDGLHRRIVLCGISLGHVSLLAEISGVETDDRG